MWHTVVGYCTVAATSAIVVRHFGAPRLVTQVFVLLGLAASVMTVLSAEGGIVDPHASGIYVAEELAHPIFYKSACNCGVW